MLDCSQHEDPLSDAAMTRLLDVIVQSLHKSTSRAKESPSYAVSAMVGRVGEHAANALHHDVQSAGRKRGGDDGADADRAKKKGRRGTKKKAADGGGTQNKPANGQATGGPKWPDVAGASGPNGLPRKVGGNRDGDPCKDFVAGKCRFKTCSFSHAKPVV